MRLNFEDSPAQAGERDFFVILAQQSGTAERRSQFAGTSYDSADDERIVEIRCSNRVHAEDSDSQRAAFERDVVDVTSLVVVDGT